MTIRRYLAARKAALAVRRREPFDPFDCAAVKARRDEIRMALAFLNGSAKRNTRKAGGVGR